MRFYRSGEESPEPELARAFRPGGLAARSPVAPDDFTRLRRSVEEFRSLCRPLDHVGVRHYRPRYLTVEQLRILIEPLLSESRGQAYPAPPNRLAGQHAAASASGVLEVRDRLEVLDRLDRVVPLLDTAPTYVSLEAMVLDIRLSGDAVDFQRLIQKRHLTPAEHTRRAPGNRAPSPDATGLKVAYLNGEINGLIEALGAFGTATLVATPRVAVRPGTEAEIELEAAGTGPDAASTSSGPAAGQVLPADAARASVARLLVRPQAAYEGGMDLEVRTLAALPRPETNQAGPRARTARGEDSGTRPRQASASIVVPDGVTLVIGGLGQPRTEGEAPADKASFLGIRPFWSRPAGDRHELLVLVAPRLVGTTPAELAKEADALDGTLRRMVAEQYLRAAERAEKARQEALALQWVEQALRFDGAQPAAAELYDRLQRTAVAVRSTWR